ncbi:hypothetical protein [Pseudokineococcus lusitanus]|uniref:Uncharacterized protein n=1 Tax=Pseudokineococcus lusitanus TaxID=763993 RepID=A0A3N1HTI7_9ACTN|nr:hypothetical protein [Pseudokineococcus lusitanus]ROP45730.1 hypothetical protein EDC03_0335 [Pseudokineococcus lusitanus]
MVVVWSVLTGLSLLQVVRRLVAVRRPPSGERVVEPLALRAGLPMPASSGARGAALQERVVERMLRRDLAAACGGLVVAVLVLAVVLVARATGVPDGSPVAVPDGADWLPLLLAVALLLAGRATASALVAGHQALQQPVLGAPRVARVRSPHLADYVPHPETGAVRLVVGLSAAAAAGLAVAASVGRVAWSVVVAPAAAAAVLVVALVALELVCRRVLAQQQPAGSALELAWDDVLRGQLLRDLVSLPLLLALVTCLQTWPTAATAWGLGGSAPVTWLPLLVMGLAVAVLVSALVRPAERRSRERLWPDTEALLVGEDVHGIRPGTGMAAGPTP